MQLQRGKRHLPEEHKRNLTTLLYVSEDFKTDECLDGGLQKFQPHNPNMYKKK
jgi:hypothetical protein